MKQRHAQALAGRLANDCHIAQRGLNLIDRRKRRRHPQGKLVGRDIGLALDGTLGILGVAGKVKSRHGEARIVAAVEIHGVVLVVDAHANHRVRGRRVVHKRIRNVEPPRHNADLLAIAKAPVQVTTQIHVAGIIGKSNARAHSAS